VLAACGGNQVLKGQAACGGNQVLKGQAACDGSQVLKGHDFSRAAGVSTFFKQQRRRQVLDE
jgi:hypothetical protein